MISYLMRDGVSLENPSTSIEDFARDWAGGEPSDAGLRVTRDRVLGHPAIFGGILKGSRALARIPMKLYRRTDDGEGKEVARDDDRYRLVRRRPDPDISAFTFFQTLTGHIFFGGAYAYIFRRGGRPVGLFPLNPENCEYVADGRDSFFITYVGAEPRRLDARDVLHVPSLSFDGKRGYELLKILKNAFALPLAQRKYRTVYYRNNGRASTALEAPPGFTQEARERLIASWRAAASGLDQAHRAVLLEEGVKVHTFASNMRDGQAIEAEEHELVQIANILGIPPHKVGAKSNVSYKSLEQENQSFLDDLIDPICCAIEQEFSEKLLTDAEKKGEAYFFEFDRKAVVRADMATRFEAYNKAILGGWLARDEARAAENMNPIPDGEGKKFLVAVNMKPAGEDAPKEDDDESAAGSSNTSPNSDNNENEGEATNSSRSSNTSPNNLTTPADNAARRALEEIYARDWGRMTRRVATHAARQAAKGGNFLAWLDTMTLEAEHGRTVREALAPSAGVLLAGQDVGAAFFERARATILDLAGRATNCAELATLIEKMEIDRLSVEGANDE